MEREKHRDDGWIVWTAIAVAAWLILSILVSLANPVFARSVWPLLFYVFVLAYSYLAICLLANRMKTWGEYYLDHLLKQRGRGKERDAQRITAMIEQVGEMEIKVDRIEAMLMDVSS